jgi:hypothetical protein
MTPFTHPLSFPRVKTVSDFDALVSTPFTNGVNALCWPRSLDGDYAEVMRAISGDDPIINLDDTALRSLSLTAVGRLAAETMIADLHRLRARGLDPSLNCINGYPHDDDPGPVRTDVFSFHADRAPFEADTWLCTYCGPSSEGVDAPPYRSSTHTRRAAQHLWRHRRR